MRRHLWRALALLPAAVFVVPAVAQSQMNWDAVRERFRQNNPNLLVGRTNVEETRAIEITAGLRPNPQLSLTIDQWNFFSTDPFRPFGASQTITSISQLIERRNKRGLRVDSAKLATSVSATDLLDLERTLLFTLRDAFVRTLQAKSILELAEQNLKYYDDVIERNRRRFEAGDIARSDYDRIAIQKSQYQTDLETAKVNLRTSKIQLLSLMNDRHAVDEFDVNGPFDFTERVLLPEELHQAAADARGDVRSAELAIQKARVDNKLAWANGSTDPFVGGDYTRLGPSNTVGVALSVPLRIYDRNQGEKARTAIEIRRTEENRAAILSGVYRDIDTAYAQVESVRSLLRPYKTTYLPQAVRIRETVSYAYSKGGVSLLDFLDAQKAYRDIELSYRNLVASYLSAANQLNLAVGQEVLQ